MPQPSPLVPIVLLALATACAAANISLEIAARPTQLSSDGHTLSVSLDVTVLLPRRAGWPRPDENPLPAVEGGFIVVPRLSLADPFVPAPAQRLLDARWHTPSELAVRVRLEASVHCSLVAHLFPFDRTDCRAHLRTQGWTKAEPVRLWSAEGEVVGDFSLTGAEAASAPCPEGTPGDCARLVFRLRRRPWRLLASVYVPTALIVCLTFLLPWITFLVVPARAVVSCLTFVNIAGHTVGARAVIPESAGYCLLDLWLHGCLLSTFCANLGFVMVHRANYQVEKRKKDEKAKAAKEAKDEDVEEQMGFDCQPKRVDVFARVVLPLIFFLFNVTYWISVALLTR